MFFCNSLPRNWEHMTYVPAQLTKILLNIWIEVGTSYDFCFSVIMKVYEIYPLNYVHMVNYVNVAIHVTCKGRKEIIFITTS